VQKELLVLIECVLGALGLALDQAASDTSAGARRSRLQDKTDRLHRILPRRLASLTKLRRRIEATKSELASATDPQELQRLRELVAKLEQVYTKRAHALRDGRRKLARWQEELR
jgi:hypothetical protein